MDGMKILALSGWAQSPDALKSIVPNAQILDYVEYDHKSIHRHTGEYDAVVAWSLGGVLARQLLHSGAIKARALISIAAPYQFVRSPHCHDAMPRDVFEQFYANFAANVQRTSTRFTGLLMKGDANASSIKAHAQPHPRLPEAQHWLRWLDFLRDYSAQNHNYSRLPRTLIIHGAHDAIVPAQQGEMLAEKLGAQLHMLPQAGHAPHWHSPQAMQNTIAEFVA